MRTLTRFLKNLETTILTIVLIFWWGILIVDPVAGAMTPTTTEVVDCRSSWPRILFALEILLIMVRPSLIQFIRGSPT